MRKHSILYPAVDDRSSKKRGGESVVDCGVNPFNPGGKRKRFAVTIIKADVAPSLGHISAMSSRSIRNGDTMTIRKLLFAKTLRPVPVRRECSAKG